MVQYPEQLLLNLSFPKSFAEADFYQGACHNEAYTWVKNKDRWPYGVCLIQGEKGSGKSHLCHIFAQLNQALSIDETWNPAYLCKEEKYFYLEDVEQKIAHSSFEENLFHLLNWTHHNKGSLLITTHILPHNLPVHLKDLSSRLRAAPCVRIPQPDDATFTFLLAKQLYDRGLTLKPEALDFALRYCVRTYESIGRIVRLLHTQQLNKKAELSMRDIKHSLMEMEDT
jgi:chromosomal replication initiation ATPase DnaA